VIDSRAGPKSGQQEDRRAREKHQLTAHRAHPPDAGEDRRLRRPIEPRVQPPPRLRSEAVLPRDPTVDPVKDLAEGREAETPPETPHGERDPGGGARTEGGPRQLGG